ncbi:MAG: GIY-YIG nuclease family protein [Phycisphaeraceae bacterium]|nr:GIY-YIG nuclease family protein [Phycisphaeraceae bacterium]
MSFYTYILKSDKDASLYVGHTQELDRRIKQHNSPNSKTYTAKRGPWTLVHKESHADRSTAMKRELFLKSHAGAHEKKTLAQGKK